MDDAAKVNLRAYGLGCCLNEREVIKGLGPNGEELRLRQRGVAQVMIAVLDAG